MLAVPLLAVVLDHLGYCDGRDCVGGDAMSEIINTYDQLRHWKEAGIVGPIGISPAQMPKCSSSGGTYRNGWHVFHVGKKLDPDAHFLHNGQKHFARWQVKCIGTWREEEAAVLVLAQAWCKEQFGITEWERNRMGDYVPAPLNSKFPLRKAQR